MKGMGIIKKLSNVPPSYYTFFTIYKHFVKNNSTMVIWSITNQIMVFCPQIKSIQHNASLLVADASKGRSKFKLYNEIGLECLKLRR